MNKCPLNNPRCWAVDCSCPKDPDLEQEQFKDTLQAKQDNADLGLIEIKLNKHDLVTIDTVNHTITTTGTLSFKEFEFISETYRGLR